MMMFGSGALTGSSTSAYRWTTATIFWPSRGQLDMENGNHMLSTALNVIRISQEMLGEVSNA